MLRGLRGAIEEQTGWMSKADNDDLFRCGLDSLQALNLSRRINAASGLATLLDPRDVYSHPTRNWRISYARDAVFRSMVWRTISWPGFVLMK